MFDVPISGTHGHSWVMSFADELTAFRAYAEAFPDNCLLLVDTYDTLRSGVPKAINVFKELKEKGHKPIGINVAQVPIFARLLRGAMLSQGSRDYVLAARALGVRKHKIALAHILPNSLGPVIVQSTLTLATAIIDAAALSYLGLGNPDPAFPEWGTMLADAQRFLSSAPQLAVYPALAIIVTALGFTLLGEAMREALDPKLRK